MAQMVSCVCINFASYLRFTNAKIQQTSEIYKACFNILQRVPNIFVDTTKKRCSLLCRSIVFVNEVLADEAVEGELAWACNV